MATKYNVLAFVTCCIKVHGVEADSPREAAAIGGDIAAANGHRVFDVEHCPPFDSDGHEIEPYGFDDDVTDYLVDEVGDEENEHSRRFWDHASPTARLGAALSRLLESPDLNHDSLELETVAAITAAQKLLEDLRATETTEEPKLTTAASP